MPVLLDLLLPRRTGRPEVDVLFPKTKGGPYYRHSWTYFVPRPGHLRPDDSEEAPQALYAPTVSTSPSVSPLLSQQSSAEPEADSSRLRPPTSASPRCRFPSIRPYPWAPGGSLLLEGALRLLGWNGLNGAELLLAAAEFMDTNNVLFNCDTSSLIESQGTFRAGTTAIPRSDFPSTSQVQRESCPEVMHDLPHLML